ncbi:Phosphate-specific transport system accessory protein PhoU [Candidatus Methanoperedenaceae archaeon GB50]|nr:Phosphate-specific transport system accessory protein PhoU [Candidatus Methanoperedenaceae archaeon GB50]
MERRFHNELNDLKMNLLKMASMVERSLGDSLKAFRERDEKLAKEIIKRDDEIDNIEMQIDKQGLSLLARYQPMA